MNTASHYRMNRRTTDDASGLVSVFANVRLVNVLLIVVVAAFFVGYLVMNNLAATKGFEIRAAEGRISDLREQGERLDLKVVELQAMRNIESQVAGLGLVPVTDLDYMGSGPASVAVK